MVELFDYLRTSPYPSVPISVNPYRLCGAILTYRSVFRLGLQGVGGAEPHFLKGIITGTRENGTVDFKCDLESQHKLQEAVRDKLAGFIGIFFIVFGTFVWGYGDLIGRILSVA